MHCLSKIISLQQVNALFCINRFLVDMMNFPDLIRNVAIVGHLHHGKTSFIDMLVNETHSSVAWDVDRQVFYNF